MKKIRVLYLIESLAPGGAERRLINDLKFLDKEKFETAVCVLENRTPLENEISRLGITLFKMGFQGFLDFQGIGRLFRQIKAFYPDILHTQLFWADILGRVVGKIAGVGVVVTTVQSSVYEPENRYLFSRKRKYLDMLTGWMFTRKYIAVSEFVKASIIKRLKVKKEKIEVIYNSIDCEYYRGLLDHNALRALKQEMGLTGCYPVLSTVGRLNSPKGHRYLFEAISLLAPELPLLKLLVVGDGPDRKKLEEYAKELDIASKVIFMGVRDDVKQIVQASDIFVFPTLSEGMPISLMEAMFLGKLCIASDIGPIREIISDNDTGYLFAAGNSKELALRIQQACDSPEAREEIALRGAESVGMRFSSIKTAGQLGVFYEKLISESRMNS